MADPTRILIADDHAMFRAGIRALLENEPLMEIVGEVSSGDDAVDQVRILKPHVVLMDLSMPGSSGLEATRRIAALHLDTAILVLTAHAEEEYLVPVVEAGASGYLIKESEIGELMLAIQAVARGNHYFSSSLSQGDDPNDFVLRARSDVKSGYDRLTDREREVLQLIAEGHANRTIAEQLVISVKTVEAHKAHIMSKLGARNRTDLIRYAIRRGIISLEPGAKRYAS